MRELTVLHFFDDLKCFIIWGEIIPQIWTRVREFEFEFELDFKLDFELDF